MQQSNWMIYIQFSCFFTFKRDEKYIAYKKYQKKIIILKREARILFISIFVLY